MKSIIFYILLGNCFRGFTSLLRGGGWGLAGGRRYDWMTLWGAGGEGAGHSDGLRALRLYAL